MRTMKHLKAFEATYNIAKTGKLTEQSSVRTLSTLKTKFKIGDIVWVHCTPNDFYNINRDVDEPMKIIFIRENYNNVQKVRTEQSSVTRTKTTSYEYGVQFLNNKTDYADFEVMEDAVRKLEDYEINALKYNL